MGSTRGLGTSTDLKLQRRLRENKAYLDESQIGSPARGDLSTRFDRAAERDDNLIRQEIGRKQEVRFAQAIAHSIVERDSRKARTDRWKSVIAQPDRLPLPVEQDDFFLKVWPDEQTETDPPAAIRATTADTSATTQPQVSRSFFVTTNSMPSFITARRLTELPLVMMPQLSQIQLYLKVRERLNHPSPGRVL